jgi:acid phosphatase type 7
MHRRDEEDTNIIRKHSIYHRRPGGQGKISSIYDKTIREEEKIAQTKYADPPEPTGPSPYHLSLDKILSQKEIASIKAAKILVFHATGDTGGIYQGEYQQLVADSMEEDHGVETNDPSFFYHLGDVIYFRGESASYYPQFYEPYRSYPGPIVAIPGNHDGMAIPSDPPSLTAFVSNFCTVQPEISPDAQGIPRYTMTQPNVYWTLEAPFVTIIGLYSNIHESDGDIREPQLQWFVNELNQAPKDKALIVAVHHPAYSADNVHGGSRKMGKILDDAFEESDRIPNLVLHGHVHNYQRYSRDIDGKQLPYVIAGAGGYHNLHKLQKHHNGAKIEVPFTMEDSGTVLEEYSDDMYGYLRLEVSPNKITGRYFGVAYHDEPDHQDKRQIDFFEIDWANHKITQGSSL